METRGKDIREHSEEKRGNWKNKRGKIKRKSSGDKKAEKLQ
ncbi:MAG: hypothetical protein AB3K77_09710 [Methanosarcinaceae archaeon]|nr:hypothetical protein [Methanosarcina sp. MTP4]